MGEVQVPEIVDALIQLARFDSWIIGQLPVSVKTRYFCSISFKNKKTGKIQALNKGADSAPEAIYKAIKATDDAQEG